MSSFKRNYSSYKSYSKPKTVGFNDSEAEEDTEFDLDSEPGDQEYFEFLVDKLEVINSKLDTITEQYQKVLNGISVLLKDQQ